MKTVVVFFSIRDPVEFISLVGSRRKGHWVGLFSTGFFFLVVYRP